MQEVYCTVLRFALELWNETSTLLERRQFHLKESAKAAEMRRRLTNQKIGVLNFGFCSTRMPPRHVVSEKAAEKVAIEKTLHSIGAGYLIRCTFSVATPLFLTFTVMS